MCGGLNLGPVDCGELALRGMSPEPRGLRERGSSWGSSAASASASSGNRSFASVPEEMADIVVAVHALLDNGAHCAVRIPVKLTDTAEHMVRRVCQIMNHKFALGVTYHKVGLEMPDAQSEPSPKKDTKTGILTLLKRVQKKAKATLRKGSPQSQQPAIPPAIIFSTEHTLSSIQYLQRCRSTGEEPHLVLLPHAAPSLLSRRRAPSKTLSVATPPTRCL